MPAPAFPYKFVREKLLRWFESNARQYPWRTTGNWFHLLMAEMMLRRTRADQADRVYRSFTQEFETPAASAAAGKARLLKIFKPLGLRWRAEQLIHTIDYLKDQYESRAPAREDDLRKIPGVGEYADALLRNRLYGEKLPALDSNMARLICRIAGLKFSQESRRNRSIKQIAHQLVQTKHSQKLNLAVLDFCALVCKPSRPDCAACTLQKQCKFAQGGSTRRVISRRP